MKEEEIRSLSRDLVTTKAALANMRMAVDKLSVYRMFLDLVVSQRPDIFPTIGIMMARLRSFLDRLHA